MSGNVWEWCLDWYKEDFYATSSTKNPKNTASGGYRVLRGGSWNYDATYCRVAYRHYESDNRSRGNGFRVVSF